jgi:hypothetical protein
MEIHLEISFNINSHKINNGTINSIKLNKTKIYASIKFKSIILNYISILNYKN